MATPILGLTNDYVTGDLISAAWLNDVADAVEQTRVALLDANGNESLKIATTASAVNEVTVTNAATGAAPTVAATGDDTNIDLLLAGKGTGGIRIPSASGAKLRGIYSGTVAVNPASIAAQSSAETAVTITGVAAGDIVLFNSPASLETGLAFSGARVSAADTVQVRLTNVTGSGVDGANLTWSYLWIDLT